MIKAVVLKLVWPAYIAGVTFLTYAGLSAYFNASSIMSDHTVVEAPIELVNTSSRTKRGHTSTTYNFEYFYTANGQDYVSDYSAVNEKGERFLDEPTITVAYSNKDPAAVGALHVLQRQSSLWQSIKGILLASLIAGFIAMLVYGWALPDDEDEEEDEELAEAAHT